MKEHLAHVGKNVKKCTSTTPQALEAKEKCKKAIEAAKRKREEKNVRELELREEVNVSRVGEESEEVTCVGSSQPHKLGPIDKWTCAIDPTKADSLKQQQLNKELLKETEHEVHKFIARWAYNHGKLLVYYDVFTFKIHYLMLFMNWTLIRLHFLIIGSNIVQCM